MSGLPSLTGVELTPQVSDLGVALVHQRSPGRAGPRIALIGRSYTPTRGTGILTPGSPLGGGNDDPNFRYVRAGAPAGGNGMSWTTAFNAIPANASLQRGLTYYLAGGNYPGRTFNTSNLGTTRITLKKATVADHGTNTGWSNAYDTTVNFTSTVQFSSGYWTLEGQTGWWVTGEPYGIVINELNDKTPVLGLLVGSRDCIIRHFRLQGRTDIGTGGGSLHNSGIRLEGGANHTLSYFESTEVGACHVWGTPNNTIFEHSWCKVHHSGVGPTGTHSEIASLWDTHGNLNNFTWRYSLFTHTESTGGLQFDNSSNPASTMAVYGNIFYRPAGVSWNIGNGMVGTWTNPSEELWNCLVYNNTFIDVIDSGAGGPLVGAGINPVVGGNLQARNNLYVRGRTLDYTWFTQHSHNHYVNVGGSAGETGATTSAVVPFVDYVNLDFRLTSNTSPGTALPAPYNTDLFGRTRSTWTRGAIEWVAP